MRNLLISDTDHVLTGTLAGGSWSAAGPLVNIQDYRPQLLAQSVDAAAASSKFTVDFGSAKSVGLFYFVNLKVSSSSATVRVKAGTDPTFAVNLFDSTAVSAFPQDASGSYGEDEVIALGRTRIFVPTAPVTVRYILVEIDDHTADVAPQLGCFCACSTFEASLNFSYGWSLTPFDESDVQRVPFGSTYIQARGKRNRFNFGYTSLGETETFSLLARIVRIKGKSTPLVVSLFPADVSPALGLERSSIYGTFSSDSPISNPFFQRYAATLQIDQLI